MTSASQFTDSPHKSVTLLRDRQVLGQAVEQRDLFERRQQMRRHIGQLPFELSRGLLHGDFFADRRSQLLQSVRVPGDLGSGPVECLPDVDAKCLRRRGNLRFVMDHVGDERAHRHHRRVGCRGGQRYGQQHERRDFIHDFRPASLSDFSTCRQSFVEIQRQASDSGAERLAARAIQDCKRLPECSLERADQLICFGTSRGLRRTGWRGQDIARRRRCHQSLIVESGGHDEGSPRAGSARAC